MTANEPIAASDFALLDPGPLASPARLVALLRAGGAGAVMERVYAVGVSCADAAGNASWGVATVTVPRDAGRGGRGVEPGLGTPGGRE